MLIDIESRMRYCLAKVADNQQGAGDCRTENHDHCIIRMQG